MKILLTERAEHDLKKLGKFWAKRVIEKLEFYAKGKSAKRLINTNYGTYGFRAGKYRIVFDVNEQQGLILLYILAIKNRKVAYL